MAVLERLRALRLRRCSGPGCNGSQGGFSDWGFGLQTNFLGLPMHFDFAKQWNFKNQLTDFKLFFYLGPEF